MIRFANDLGLFAEMMSFGDFHIPPLGMQILKENFHRSEQIFTSDELDQFSRACWDAYRSEAKIVDTDTLFFRLFKTKNARGPFFTFHARFDGVGDLQSFTMTEP